MVRIFGNNLSFKKILALFLLINSFSCYLCFCVKIDLNILSTNGFKLDKAGLGIPFFLEVSVDGTNNLNELKIDGLQDFHVSQVGIKNININGHVSATRTFYVKIDKLGKYKIGPARLQEDGKDYASGVMQIEVAENQVFNDKQVENNAKSKSEKNISGQDVFLKLFADKENVVFGEKINCKVRFYYIDGQDIKIDGIAFPDISGMKILEGKVLAEPTAGTEKIDDKLYNYEQWVFTLVAKKMGKISIPAFTGVYIAVEDGPFGWPVYQQKNIFSNILSFNVEQLPKYDGVIDAVGKFIGFDATVDRVVAKQGDGIVYTLELEGLGDLESIEIKELKNMPKDLKYYDSKRYIVDNSAKEGMKKKRFEFIVQGLGSGDTLVPSQTFTFFDTQSRQYKVLKSSPVNLNILAVAGGISSGDLGGKNGPDRVVDSRNKHSRQGRKENINIMPIFQSGDWFELKDKKINFWLFLLLIFMPIFLIFTVFLKKLREIIAQARFSKDYSQSSIKKNSFKKALRNLEVAKTKNNFVSLYSIFVTLFAERFNLDDSCVTVEKMAEILGNNNFLQQDLKDWEVFIAKIMAYAFCDKDKVGKVELTIFAQAISWVDKFKQKFNN